MYNKSNYDSWNKDSQHIYYIMFSIISLSSSCIACSTFFSSICVFTDFLIVNIGILLSFIAYSLYTCLQWWIILANISEITLEKHILVLPITIQYQTTKQSYQVSTKSQSYQSPIQYKFCQKITHYKQKFNISPTK